MNCRWNRARYGGGATLPSPYSLENAEEATPVAGLAVQTLGTIRLLLLLPPPPSLRGAPPHSTATSLPSREFSNLPHL